MAVVSFKNGLKDDCLFRKSLAKTLPKSMEKLMARIEKYARAEEDMPGTKAPKQEKRNGSLKRSRDNTRYEKTRAQPKKANPGFQISDPRS